LEHSNLKPPFICLVISGGHSDLVLVKDRGDYEKLGQTRDDAPGEAFDKVAKLLEIGYPGGPLIDKLSEKGNPNFFKFPRAYLEQSFDFSFSGIKTAVALYVAKKSSKEIKEQKKDTVASFQEAVVDVLVEKVIKAALFKDVKKIALAGGVASNSRLREKLKIRSAEQSLEVFFPAPSLCTDNAAMIAVAGDFRLSCGERSDLDLNAVPYAKLVD